MNKVDNCTIGGRIREQRKKIAWSQDNLADELDTTKSLISQYERGKVNPSPSKIEEMAVLLKTTPEYLQFGVANSAVTDKRLNQIIIWYTSIEDETQKDYLYANMENFMKLISKS